MTEDTESKVAAITGGSSGGRGNGATSYAGFAMQSDHVMNLRANPAQHRVNTVIRLRVEADLGLGREFNDHID